MRQILFVRWEQDDGAACFALHRFTTIRDCLKNTRLHLPIALKVTQSWSQFGWRSASKVGLAEVIFVVPAKSGGLNGSTQHSAQTHIH
jgi:hypothetical protein